MKIPGVTFSWKRALGVTQAKQQIARKNGHSNIKSRSWTQDWQHDYQIYLW